MRKRLSIHHELLEERTRNSPQIEKAKGVNAVTALLFFLNFRATPFTLLLRVISSLPPVGSLVVLPTLTPNCMSSRHTLSVSFISLNLML